MPVGATSVDDDWERQNEEKTSSVHFLRFELTPPMKQALAAGAGIGIGVDHPAYRVTCIDSLTPSIRASLIEDLRM